MPKMDGIETSKKIRQLFGGDVLIYGLSGYSDPEEKKKCLSAGMNDYFTKPLKISVFIDKLKTLVKS